MDVIPCADTNWLIAAYVAGPEDRLAKIVNRFVLRKGPAWQVPPVVAYECENAFARLTGKANSTAWQRFQADLGNRLRPLDEAWDVDGRKVREIFRQFSSKGTIGTMDTFILASVLRAGATHFLSFDTNSNLRALAAVLKLKVFPELTAEDRRRMKLFR